ncbi:MAG: putative transcription activator [Frankiales bacterium]|nr:putative transcription activator [Frankiales bacterium]
MLPDLPPDLWTAATRSPFLDGVRDGSLDPGVLDVWLAQDARFVADLLAFQARLLARAPRPAQAVLAAGCTALVAELDWFTDLAARRGLSLDVAPLPATRAYADLLQRLDAAPYVDAVAALWVLERVYLDAWSGVRPGAEPYRELVEHWTVPEFARYVADLEVLADAQADPALLREVLELEAAFWPVP